MHACSHLKQGERVGLNQSDWLAQVCPSACPKLNQANSLAPLESLSVRHRGNSDLKRHPRRVGTATAGTYTGSTSEVRSWPQPSRQPRPQHTPSAHAHKHLLFQHCSPLGQGCWSGEGEHTFKGKPQLTPGCSPRLSILSTISYQGDSCWYNL